MESGLSLPSNSCRRRAETALLTTKLGISRGRWMAHSSGCDACRLINTRGRQWLAFFPNPTYRAIAAGRCVGFDEAWHPASSRP
jgi:hypothetical protein